MADIATKVKEFIMQEFLPGEDPDQLTDSTPLIAGGILDSLATLKVVSFLEETYKIRVEAYETDEDNFGTIADIEKLVQSKQ
jgi:acyl carrier protein